ncbi:hypothetical protein ACWKWC_04850 [Geodermatophilus nigrescens]
MRDLLAAVLPTVVVVAVLLVVLRSARPGRGEGSRGARSWRALRRYGQPGLGDPAWWAVVLVTALSVGSWVPDVPTAAVLGLVTGVLAALSPYAGDLWVGGLGLVGAVDTARRLWVGDPCLDAPPTARAASLLVVVVLGLPAFVVGRHLPGNRRSTSLAMAGLSLSAAVDVAALLSTPLGVPVVGAGSPGLVATSALAAAVLGLGFGYAPVVGSVLLGAAVALVSASGAAVSGTTCSLAGDAGQVTAVVAFGIAAVAVRAAGRRVVPGR